MGTGKVSTSAPVVNKGWELIPELACISTGRSKQPIIKQEITNTGISENGLRKLIRFNKMVESRKEGY